MSVLCLVTDRRQFGAALIDVVAAAARAGVDLVQIREPDLPGRELLALVRACLSALGGTPTRVVVNDRLDIAIAARAHGVHLSSRSVDASRVREIAPPGFLVGRSIHGAAEAADVAARGGLDYLIAGTVFSSASKPDTTRLLGVEGLRDIVRAVQIPVLAIGGVTEQTAAEVAATGASGIAAIGLFLQSPAALGDVVSRLRLEFDTARPDSLT